MDSIFNLNTLLMVNLVVLTCLFFYLLTKIKKHPSVAYFVASLTPLIAFHVGSYMFSNWPGSQDGARLVLFGVTLTPLTIVPLSHTLGRTRPEHPQKTWIAYYALQIVLLVFVTRGIFAGRMIEWVTGILDQPIIIIEQSWRYYFLNVVATSMLALMCFDIRCLLRLFVGEYSHVFVRVPVSGANGSSHYFVWFNISLLWLREIPVLAGHDPCLPARGLRMPFGHGSVRIHHYFRKHSRRAALAATAGLYRTPPVRGLRSSRAFSRVLFVAAFSQHHSKLCHETFFSQQIRL